MLSHRCPPGTREIFCEASGRLKDYFCRCAGRCKEDLEQPLGLQVHNIYLRWGLQGRSMGPTCLGYSEPHGTLQLVGAGHDA